jgi:hypothetical protein
VNDRTRPELVLLLALVALAAGVVAALVAIALAVDVI